MKNYFMLAFMALALNANAQEKTTIEVPQWVNNIKFSGYGMLQYQGTDQEDAKSNTFNLRLARFILDGKIGDFDWRAQIQGTNATGPGQPTVQLVDLYAEWRKYPEFKIRAGQFKRAFTYENPTHPITQGWRGYADVINNLSGFGDRTGEKSSGGRDIGIQFSGDLFPNADGRRLFHYQIGIYNGEGVNQKDADNRKDIIGGIWVMPIKGLRMDGRVAVATCLIQTPTPPAALARTAMLSLLSTLRVNTCSVLSICTLRVGALLQQATTCAPLTTPRATRPMVGMSSVSCPSSRVSFTQRPVTSAIVHRRNGTPPRLHTKLVSTTSSQRIWRCTWSMHASTTANWRNTTTTS